MITKLTVEGMNCGGCAKKVEESVKKAGAAGEVNLKEKSITVEFDETKVSLDAVKDSIASIGYHVS
ncbi:cation transporter [Gorillibacterium sp. CAU 1737]|uniref:heavy-metal-associated domain-containing protein n=1 Tax=Gorillibacterium sp. CAU 1737 TaxID=3140362 RepID=UPI0032602312